MSGALAVATVAGVALATTSAFIVGTTLGLYLPLSRRLLAALMAFASGVLISSLAVEFAFHGALHLHEKGHSTPVAWMFIAGGFAVGSALYYSTSLFLDRRGAAVRSSTRFREFILERKREDIELLSKSDLLRHMPPEAIEELLTHLRERHADPGEILFGAGDPGDALYIVARGSVEVLNPPTPDEPAERQIAVLGPGSAVGEMALLNGAPRSATVKAGPATELLQIDKQDFDQLVARDHEFAAALHRLSHDRALSNLQGGGTDSRKWANVAKMSLDRLSRRETEKMLAEAGSGAGIAIVLGDLLDTLPGLFVVGAKFAGIETLALAIMMGIFIGGLPNSATSAPLLRKVGYTARAIYGFWVITIVAGMISAVAGYLLIRDTTSLVAILVEAMAGGSLLALVTHGMIPEALHRAGSLIVMPTVAGFIFALFVILTQFPL